MIIRQEERTDGVERVRFTSPDGEVHFATAERWRSVAGIWNKAVLTFPGVGAIPVEVGRVYATAIALACGEARIMDRRSIAEHTNGHA